MGTYHEKNRKQKQERFGEIQSASKLAHSKGFANRESSRAERCGKIRSYSFWREGLMIEPLPGFWTRVALAFRVFFRAIADPELAAALQRLLSGVPEPVLRLETPPPTAPAFKRPPPDAALQLLGLLQQEGRFVDFLQEDVSSFADAEIGAAARVVHEGCRKAIHDHFQIVPIRQEEEGTRVTLESGFDPSAVRLTGNVVGRPPFRGSLIHRGWRVAEVNLPKVADGHDTRVLAAAEVEL
jgi:hypothetical protein